METYIIDKENFSIESVIKLLAEGKHPLCPVCKSPVLVAIDPEQAKELGIPPGMQCSRAAKHFQIEFLFKSNK